MAMTTRKGHPRDRTFARIAAPQARCELQNECGFYSVNTALRNHSVRQVVAAYCQSRKHTECVHYKHYMATRRCLPYDISPVGASVL